MKSSCKLKFKNFHSIDQPITRIDHKSFMNQIRLRYLLQLQSWSSLLSSYCNSKYISLPELIRSDIEFQLSEPVSFRSCIVFVRIVMILEMIIQYFYRVSQRYLNYLDGMLPPTCAQNSCICSFFGLVNP